jgi:hypothetical protein
MIFQGRYMEKREVFVEKSVGQPPLGKPRRRWEKTECKDDGWLHLARVLVRY